ncbi:MAG: hypothetical protein F6J94_09260 [Moorea sp. SIO1F2]|uniref:hypothetical protein n=1 Tax=unclassified Moorena TaxID=2683338 RepID=UPI0013BB24C6|nr:MULTISPECIES: hypothetical protein [unclassified Moorena]NEN94573.1 hypothetical protein [Moorena sp. SIO3I7]NEO08706.1 hypothetical protein [Moorena sp. SIO3I8]NEO22176.1 hypothetical protein [Moorena sp. SIO4A5]NEP25228.1 hypothetical protein [Moorena sp. SIO3I6]NEQ57605.1 hypothetical protein [Moorena sp. SIO4A1]
MAKKLVQFMMVVLFAMILYATPANASSVQECKANTPSCEGTLKQGEKLIVHSGWMHPNSLYVTPKGKATYAITYNYNTEQYKDVTEEKEFYTLGEVMTISLTDEQGEVSYKSVSHPRR